jgi:hypothetical protein
MPIPIMPQNTSSLERKERDSQISVVDYCKLDISDLSGIIQKRSNYQDMIKVSNLEAGILFKLWKDSKTQSCEDFMNVPSEFSNNDLLRLKASGLVSGDTEKVKFTPRGKEVIVTMVLSEKNDLDKTSSAKTYEQRYAETKPKGGPRLAVGKKI